MRDLTPCLNEEREREEKQASDEKKTLLLFCVTEGYAAEMGREEGFRLD